MISIASQNENLLSAGIHLATRRSGFRGSCFSASSRDAQRDAQRSGSAPVLELLKRDDLRRHERAGEDARLLGAERGGRQQKVELVRLEAAKRRLVAESTRHQVVIVDRNELAQHANSDELRCEDAKRTRDETTNKTNVDAPTPTRRYASQGIDRLCAARPRAPARARHSRPFGGRRPCAPPAQSPAPCRRCRTALGTWPRRSAPTADSCDRSGPASPSARTARSDTGKPGLV